MRVEGGLGAIGVPAAACINDRDMLFQRAQGDGCSDPAIEPQEAQVIVHAAIAGVDQGIAQDADHRIVQFALKLLHDKQIVRLQPSFSNFGYEYPMPMADRIDQRLVALFGEDPDCRAFENRPELIGGARQLKAGPNELNAGARVDRKNSLGLQNSERISQRCNRYVNDLGQFTLRHERAGLNPTLEESFENALVSQIAQSLRRRRIVIDGGEFYLSGHLHALMFWHIR